MEYGVLSIIGFNHISLEDARQLKLVQESQKKRKWFVAFLKGLFLGHYYFYCISTIFKCHKKKLLFADKNLKSLEAISVKN